MTADTITAISAVTVAVLALGVSLWQGALQRRHNRLSVRPHLRLDWLIDDVDDQQKVSIVLSNNGLGPAVLTMFKWIVDETPIATSWFDAPGEITRLLPLNQWEHELYTPSPNEPMSHGERHFLLKVLTQDMDDTGRLEEVLGRLSIRVSYCSMYEEQFMLQQIVGRPPSSNSGMHPTAG